MKDVISQFPQKLKRTERCQSNHISKQAIETNRNVQESLFFLCHLIYILTLIFMCGLESLNKLDKYEEDFIEMRW